MSFGSIRTKQRLFALISYYDTKIMLREALAMLFYFVLRGYVLMNVSCRHSSIFIS